MAGDRLIVWHLLNLIVGLNLYLGSRFEIALRGAHLRVDGDIVTVGPELVA